MQIEESLTEFIKTQNAINDTVMNALMLAHDEIAHLKSELTNLIDQLNANQDFETNEEEPQFN